MSDDNQEQGINQYGEPWRNDFFAGMPIIVDSSGVIVFETQDEFGEPAVPENLRLRIVACINACAGIPTEQLKSLRFGNETTARCVHGIPKAEHCRECCEESCAKGMGCNV